MGLLRYLMACVVNHAPIQYKLLVRCEVHVGPFRLCHLADKRDFSKTQTKTQAPKGDGPKGERGTLGTAMP